LSNPEKKDLYDKYGMEGVKQGGGGGGFGDLFEMFGMGGKRGPKKPQKGKPVLKELKVTLEEVYSGKLFKIPHSKKQLCESCDGKGG
jgi:DnaJ family protein A protein 2